MDLLDLNLGAEIVGKQKINQELKLITIAILMKK